MYIDNDDFSVWMQKLYAKLEELCKDVRVLRNADRVLPEDDNLLDNQDLCLLFKVSIKTLQRYRAIGALPYFTISGKVYYKASDVREFIKERFSVTTLRQFVPAAVFKAFHRIGQASDESVVPFPAELRFQQIKAAAVCLSFHQDIAVSYIVVL